MTASDQIPWLARALQESIRNQDDRAKHEYIRIPTTLDFAAPMENTTCVEQQTLITSECPRRFSGEMHQADGMNLLSIEWTACCQRPDFKTSTVTHELAIATRMHALGPPNIFRLCVYRNPKMISAEGNVPKHLPFQSPPRRLVEV